MTAFYHDRGFDHRFGTWDSIHRSFQVDEELLTEDPFRMRFTIPAGEDALILSVDRDLRIVDVSS